MGTNTPNLNLYKPTIGETGWGADVNTNWDSLDSRVSDLVVNVKDYGAVGNNTDDSAAIQDAINTSASIIYFPAGIYRIGTPLVAHTGKRYLGTGAAQGYTATASVLRCTGSNHTIFDVVAGPLDRNVFDGMTFADQSSRTDTAFKGGASGGIVSSMFINCGFNALEWDFDMSPSSQYLIVWQFYTKSSGPSRFETGSYVNDNHWIGCTWNGVRNNVPAVSIQSGGVAQGNWFQNCYFESCDRQAVKFYQTVGGISSTYFEAIGEDGVTYTTRDGLTLPLPAVDITYLSSVKLEDNFRIGAGNEATAFGNTNIADGVPSTLILDEQTYWTRGYDASNLSEIHHSTNHFVSTRGDSSSMVTPWTNGIYRVWDLWEPIGGNGGQHLPVDAQYADWWEFHRGPHGGTVQNANPIVDNPTNPTRGRELTFEFSSDGGYTISSITFDTDFLTAGAIVAPAMNKRRIYRFYFDGQYWVETYRSPADIG